MAILLIENARESRATLHQFLNELGAESVHEFVECKSAKSHLSSKTIFELVIASAEDPDFPSFCEELQKQSHLVGTICLATTSRFFRRPSHPRVDFLLHKPFGLRTFFDSICRAAKVRAHFQNEVLAVGFNSRQVESLQEYFHFRQRQIYSKARFVSSFAEGCAFLRSEEHKLGAVFFGQQAHIETDRASLKQFMGVLSERRSIPLVSFNRLPNQELPFARFYLDHPNTTAGLDSLFFLCEQSLQLNWRRKTLSFLAKKEILANSRHKARRRIAQLIAEDPQNSQAACMAGEFFEHQGMNEKAAEHFLKGIELNPFYPKAYVHLLKLLANSPRRSQVLAQAQAYCSSHPQMAKYFSGSEIGGKVA